MSSEIVVVALIYLDRLVVRSLKDEDGEFCLTQTNIRHAINGCLALATKFYNDKYESRTMFSTVAGITRREMRNIMDLILDVIEFDLVVREEDYSMYENKLHCLIKERYKEKGQTAYFSRAEF
jgi:Cyclin